MKEYLYQKGYKYAMIVLYGFAILIFPLPVLVLFLTRFSIMNLIAVLMLIYVFTTIPKFFLFKYKGIATDGFIINGIKNDGSYELIGNKNTINVFKSYFASSGLNSLPPLVLNDGFVIMSEKGKLPVRFMSTNARIELSKLFLTREILLKSNSENSIYTKESSKIVKGAYFTIVGLFTLLFFNIMYDSLRIKGEIDMHYFGIMSIVMLIIIFIPLLLYLYFKKRKIKK